MKPFQGNARGRRQGPCKWICSWYVCGIVFVVLMLPLSASAAMRWVEGTLSTSITDIMREPAGYRLFAADAGNQRLIVIDAADEMVSHLLLPGVPGELAISGDRRTLAVSLGTAGIALVSLASMTVTETLSPGHDVVSLAFVISEISFIPPRITGGKSITSTPKPAQRFVNLALAAP